MSPEVVLVRTGTANLASMRAGLARAGAEPRPARGADDVRDAARVLLPGVGAFAAARRALAEDGLDDALRDRIAAGRPTLCVCVGLQLLCAASEESPGTDGLGVVPGTVRRLGGGAASVAGGTNAGADAGAAVPPPGPVRVPQMGWNRLEPSPDARRLPAGHVYFANSYALLAPPEGWAVAVADHGGRFVGGLERGPVLACQFHPELSGPLGAALLRRWVEEA